MAATTDQADCPLCDDYTGPPSSVEAHISRMTDPVHQGETGQGHRDDLLRQVEEGEEEPLQDDVEADDSGVDESVDFEEPEEADEAGGVEDGDGVEPEETAAAAAAGGVGLLATKEWDRSTLLVIGVVVLVVVLWWVSRSDGDEGTEEIEEDQQESMAATGEGGGLV